jgi:hypothetical protein
LHAPPLFEVINIFTILHAPPLFEVINIFTILHAQKGGVRGTLVP